MFIENSVQIIYLFIYIQIFFMENTFGEKLNGY